MPNSGCSDHIRMEAAAEDLRKMAVQITDSDQTQTDDEITQE